MTGVCGPSSLALLLACLALWNGLFDCTQEKKIFLGGLLAFVRGMNDGFDCCAGILIFLLFSFFSFLFYFRNGRIVSR